MPDASLYLAPHYLILQSIAACHDTSFEPTTSLWTTVGYPVASSAIGEQVFFVTVPTELSTGY
jgi:hypothetical protein